ncbi:MAG: hypothetical protein HQM04_06540 [Magnetococcales bacterium]|nr:hypothetical protein [Magnetococcales bacterium]MBF0114685.1 hypothetical protein [Magnetococcales bacterium]
MPVTILKVPFAYPDGGLIITARVTFGPEYEDKMVGITRSRRFFRHVQIVYANRTQIPLEVVVRFRYYNVDTSKTVLLKPGKTQDKLDFIGLDPPAFPNPPPTVTAPRWGSFVAVNQEALRPDPGSIWDESMSYNPYFVTSANRALDLVYAIVQDDDWIDHPTPAQISEALNWQSNLSISIADGPSISVPLEIRQRQNTPTNRLRDDLSDMLESEREMGRMQWGDQEVDFPTAITLLPGSDSGSESSDAIPFPLLERAPNNPGQKNGRGEVPKVVEKPTGMKLRLGTPLFPPVRDDLGANFASVAVFPEESRQMSTIAMPIASFLLIEDGMAQMRYASQITFGSMDGTRKIVLQINPWLAD